MSETGEKQGAAPSTLSIVLAPWWGIFRPRAAAARFAEARFLSVFIAAFCTAFVWSLVLSAVFFMSQTRSFERGSPGIVIRGSAPALGDEQPIMVYEHYGSAPVVHEHSFTEVWTDWLQTDFVQVSESCVIVFMCLLTATLIFGILRVPRIHENGPIQRSLKVAFCGAASGTGMLGLLIVLTASLILAVEYLRMVAAVQHPIYSLTDPWWITLLEQVEFLPAVVSIIWFGWAIRGVRPNPPTCDRPPLCEGCGYDLRHRPIGGRCTECGLDLARSVDPERARRGARWENHPTPRSWLSTSFAALFTPRRFYRELRMRTAADASSIFSILHYVVAAMAVGVITFVMDACVFGGRWPYILGDVLSPVVGLTLAGWALHRGLGLLVYIWWLIWRRLPNARWCAKIQDYEVVFVWVLLALAFTVECVRELVIPQVYSMSSPPPVWVIRPLAGAVPYVLAGIATALFWLWRYRVAYRAVRWSNT